MKKNTKFLYPVCLKRLKSSQHEKYVEGKNKNALKPFLLCVVMEINFVHMLVSGVMMLWAAWWSTSNCSKLIMYICTLTHWSLRKVTCYSCLENVIFGWIIWLIYRAFQQKFNWDVYLIILLMMKQWWLTHSPWIKWSPFSKCTFTYEKFYISIYISLNFVPKGPICHNPALV